MGAYVEPVLKTCRKASVRRQHDGDMNGSYFSKLTLWLSAWLTWMWSSEGAERLLLPPVPGIIRIFLKIDDAVTPPWSCFLCGDFLLSDRHELFGEINLVEVARRPGTELGGPPP